MRYSMLFLFALLPFFSQAQGIRDLMIDPDDGWVDGGNFLLKYPYGVMPVPLVITEPAVGTGGGLAVVKFHDADKAWNGEEVDPETGRSRPRSASAIAAIGTNNGSKVFGGGHFGHYRRDSIRYEGLGGAADINLKFYGDGGDQENPNGFNFNAEALFISQQLTLRMGSSDWFLGGDFQYTDMEAEFDTGIDIPGLDKGDFDSTNVAVGGLAIYDSLSNNNTPQSGVLSRISYRFFDDLAGGDFNYKLLTLKNQYHVKPANSLTLGLRADLQSVDGNAPFYALPFVNLRGIPALRYQGDHVVTLESQLGWAVKPRIELLGFVGVGRATDSMDDLKDSESHVAYGVGIRYLFVKALGMSVGLDFANGPDDSTIYFSFGTKLK